MSERISKMLYAGDRPRGNRLCVRREIRDMTHTDNHKVFGHLLKL